MTGPASRFFHDGGGNQSPRLHYLEWAPANAGGGEEPALVLLHGSSANAWWWQPLAEEIARDFRLLALDQRGHGDSDWVRPPAYLPEAYAGDLASFLSRRRLKRPIIVGHSLGGINVLAFASRHPEAIRAAVAIDVPVTSTRRRDRFMRRLRALPTVTYPDLETAKARFRLIPAEGNIPPATLLRIAEKSLGMTEDGRYSLKFDRESFFGGDGLDVLAAIRAVQVPLLLVRGEFSRVMTAEGAERGAASNPSARLRVIPGTHHHLLLERPDLLARAIEEFVAELP